MGNGEGEKASKPENSSSPSKDPNNVHVYTDWATMQAYYGPRLAVSPYLNSAVASPHAPPPYMWGPPQAMISPYGTPYAAFYAHGGIYPHPGIPLGGTTLGTETPVKSPGNADGGFVKKLKEFDGLAMSIGNGYGTDRGLSQSEETEDSSDGSIGVTEGAVNTSKKRSRQGSPDDTADGKAQRKDVLTIPALEVSRTPEKLKDVISTATVPVKTTENINAALIIKDPSNLKPSSTDFVSQTSMSKDIWLQSERELRRERRKQSNRESARRSRLKKQALSEDLAAKVQTLTTENMTLKLEMNELKERSEKLRLENATLMVNLKKMDELRMRKPFGTVNLLARVNNSDSTERDGDSYENPSSGSTLRQLLDGSPCRTADAVAAG